jgi:hypothetical protein
MHLGAREAPGGRYAATDAQEKNQDLMGAISHRSKIAEFDQFSKSDKREYCLNVALQVSPTFSPAELIEAAQ